MLRILLVDDEPNILKALQRLLRPEGYKILLAESGADGLIMMATEKVTVYGLPIVAARKVNYSQIDPALSRELFIRHALVEGDWQTRHAFFRENLKLRAEVEELEHWL